MKRRIRYPQVAPAHRKSQTKSQDPAWLASISRIVPQQFRETGAPSEKSFPPRLPL